MEEEKLIIFGQNKIKGEISATGAKNAAFPVLAAALLTTEDCIIGNVPLIEDVFRFIEIFQSMGVEVSWIGERKIKINAKKMNPGKINNETVSKFRGAVILLGTMLARFKKASLAQPGGCLIGPRPIDTHLNAFKELGVSVKRSNNKVDLSFKGPLKSNTVILDEFSVTATSNLMLFASSLTKPVLIRTADLDYPNQELMKVLNKMGVKAKVSGPHEIRVEGKSKLKGFKHDLIFDPIEAGTFIILAAATRGDVLVKNVEYPFLSFILKTLRDAGIPLEVKMKGQGKADVRVRPWKSLKIKKVQSLPYPGFPSDLLSVMGVLATQSEGQTLLHDPLYEGRLRYLEGLIKMGADVFFSDPHRATIIGVTPLYGEDLGSFDLRGGAALIIAGLIAEGRTTISNVYQIDRGYEKIEERLKKLGADIKRVKQ